MSKRRLTVEIVEVKRLAEAGYTRQQIAVETGFTYGQIRYVMRSNNIKAAYDLYRGRGDRRQSLFWEKNTRHLKALMDTGASSAEIAKKLGTTKRAIENKAQRLKLTWRRSPIWGPPAFRDRRKALGVTITTLSLYSAVRARTISALERNDPVTPAALVRIAIALAALEAGCNPDRVRAAALAAAPPRAAAGEAFDCWGTSRAPRLRPDTEMLPAGCFEAHNLVLPEDSFGKLPRPATHVERAGTLA